jgi:hypothetical protein
MGAVETSIERSGGEDAMRLGGMQLVKRSIERSGKWDVMKGGLWEADTTSAVSQRPGRWDGRLHVRSLRAMVPPTAQRTMVTHHTMARAPL